MNFTNKAHILDIMSVWVIGVAAGVIFLTNFQTPQIARAAGSLPLVGVTIDKVIGQPDDRETMTNLITANTGFHIGGVHVDALGRIYAFDSGNNRVLGFSSYAKDRAADIVIGQPSLDARGSANGNNNEYVNPTASTLSLIPYPDEPSVLEAPRQAQMGSDAQGNLYVVDLNNNRVLKYNDPFATDQVADEVWGQSDFVTRTNHCGREGRSPTASTLCTEYGSELSGTPGIQVFMSAVEIDPQGNMWVADTGNHRVLRFPNSGGVISKTADVVLGQSDFTSNSNRSGFDGSLTKMLKPISLKFDPITGDLFVLEAEWAGQARVSVFAAPFTTGMSATREFGRAVVSDSQPSDTTNWQNIGGKWVHTTTGLHWPRGMTFDPIGAGVWINDSNNVRTVYFTTDGVLTSVIGQPDLNSKTCYGLATQGYIGVDGLRHNLCNPGGEIGLSPDGHMYIATNGGADEKNIVRFALPLTRSASNVPIANGRLLYHGWNTFSGKTFYNGYGMSVLPASGSSAMQLWVTDRQRVLGWTDVGNAANFAQADVVLGQDAFNRNADNSGGLFSGLDMGPQTVGAGQLWVSGYDRIFAFALPVGAGGKNYPATKVLYTGKYPTGNVTWADDGTKVKFHASGLVFDPTANVLWVSDSDNNRVLRIADPLGAATVDLVLGQPDKNSVGENGGASGPSAKGFSDPWALQFDKLGNLYVVDSKWESGLNNRVVRFAAADLQPVQGNIFKYVSAQGVYSKQSLTSTVNWGPHTPATPSFVTFDSQNRMFLFTDGYGNLKKEQAYIYAPDHATQTTPQPSYILPIPFGQPSYAYLTDDTHLVVQDHTWNRVLFTTLQYPVAPTSVPTIAPTAVVSPTSAASPFSTMSAVLAYPANATFQFAYSGTATSYQIDLSTVATMSTDVYLSFGSGSQSPVVVTNPTKWDKYTCGRPLYWRVRLTTGEVSPIQSAIVECATVTPTLIPTAIPTPVPTLTPTRTPTPSPIPTSTPVTNLFINPGFEIDANNNGQPDGWSASTWFTRSAVQQRSGLYSGAHTTTVARNYSVYQDLPTAAVIGGRDYTFSAWIFVPATITGSLEMNLQWRNANGGVVSNMNLYTIRQTTGGWINYQQTNIKAPVKAKNVRMIMKANSLKGQVFVDDFSIR